MTEIIPFKLLYDALNNQQKVYKREFSTKGPEQSTMPCLVTSEFYYLYELASSPVKLFTGSILGNNGKPLPWESQYYEHFLNKEILLYSSIPTDLQDSNDGAFPYYVRNLFTELSKQANVEIDFSINPKDIPHLDMHVKILYSSISLNQSIEKISKHLDLEIRKLETAHNIITSYVDDFVEHERRKIQEISKKYVAS